MGRWASIDLGPESILFADDDIVAVDKPTGVLSDASRDPDRDHLGSALQRWAGDDAAVFHAAHRLDLGTSGVVLYGRNKPATTALMQQFQDRAVSKRYLAIVHQPVTAVWAIGDTFDRHTYLRHRKGVTEEVRSGGKPATTHFEILAVDSTLALVRASPKTGRTHQLRVHLAAVDAPIVGDDLYGNHEPNIERLWLHADTLQLVHPTSGEPLTLTSRRTFALANSQPVEMARTD